jgi:LPS O-antigen subunit length determinant protein (WzzB/FepE family)
VGTNCTHPAGLSSKRMVKTIRLRYIGVNNFPDQDICHMDTLQKLFEQQFKVLPELFLEKLLEKKLHAEGINTDPVMIQKLIQHVLSSNSDSFSWDDGKEGNISITINLTEADVEDAEKRFIATLPRIIEKTTTDIARLLLKSLKKNWKKESNYQEAEFHIFKKNLERRWDKALGMLRMLLTISRELGVETAKLKPPNESHLNDVLLRLHVRACQVTAEIIVLLENGYADGAMARWRTLHEIGIVMVLMRDHGEQLAERYIAHRAVEAKSGMDQYALCYEQLGYEKLDTSECNEINEAYEQAIHTYGKDFKGPYGWAAGFVKEGKRGIGLAELEAAAGRSLMASHYKLASYNVHAGPHALFFRLGLIGESGLLAGASNAGLTEPGQNTAITFTLISVLLVGDCVNFDRLVIMKIMLELRNEIPLAFGKADSKLQADHARYSK